MFLDPNWYLLVYSDVAKSGIDSHKHFWRYGWREGRINRKNLKIRKLLNMKMVSSEIDESIPDKSLILKQINSI